MQTDTDLTAPYFWHALYMKLKSQESHERNLMLESILNLSIENDYADILRLTLLSEFMDQSSRIQEVGKKLVSSNALSIDCLASHVALHCIGALRLGDRESFMHSIENASIPQIISRLTEMALFKVKHTFKPHTSQNLERVAIVTSYFGNTFHSPSALANHYAKVLTALRITVNIYSCQELMPYAMERYHGAGRKVQLPAVDEKAWPALIPSQSSIFIAHGTATMLSRWDNALKSMAQFNPDVILCVGPLSPLASALFSVRPVLALPTNTVSFLGNADLWLKGQDNLADDSEITWGGQFALPESYVHPFRIPKPQQTKLLSRQDLGLRKDVVLLITVGFRLGHDIGGAWAEQMLSFLHSHPNVVWVILGGQMPESLNATPIDQLIHLGARSDVIDVLAVCDIYINPPRMGGGFSVLEAMAMGLPTLAFVATDGGEKLGIHACADTNSYFAKLLALATNLSERQVLGNALKERFDEYYDVGNSGPSLLNACKRAMAHASMRFKNIS